MNVGQMLLLFMGGFILGGYLCKPDVPTRAWAIGFLVLLFSTIAAHLAEPQKERSNHDH